MNVRDTVRTIVKEAVDIANKKAVQHFMEEMSWYQSNHYGAYDTTALFNAYVMLPNDAKMFITMKKVGPLFRGCDGISPKAVSSFTTNPKVAQVFGAFVIPFTEVESHQGIVSTERIYKLMQRFKLDYPIGDDEGEFLVMNVKWKEGLKDRLDAYRP